MEQIEKFTSKLKRTEDMLAKTLPTAKGRDLVKTDNALNHIRGLIQSSQDLVKPGRRGTGTIGEATIRASHGEIY